MDAGSIGPVPPAFERRAARPRDEPRRWTLFLVADGGAIDAGWDALFLNLFPEAARFSSALLASLREDGVCVAMRRHREIVETRAEEVSRYARFNAVPVSCRLRADP